MKKKVDRYTILCIYKDRTMGLLGIVGQGLKPLLEYADVLDIDVLGT